MKRKPLITLPYTPFAFPTSEPDCPPRYGDERRTVFVENEAWLCVSELAARALAGEEFAALQLARVALEATKYLAAVEKKSPVLLSFARYWRQWPVLLSGHPTDQLEAKKTVKSLKVGHDSFPKRTSDRKWKPDTAAVEIVSAMNEAIRSNQAKAGFITRPFPAWVQKALKLEPLTKDTAEKWFAVGKEALRERYTNEDLLARYPIAAQSRKVPSGRIAKIFDEARTAFQRLARYPR